MLLSEFLLLERRHQKLTQAQLGEKAGISRNYVSALEHGHQNVTLSTLQAVAAALGYDIKFELKPKDKEHGTQV